MTIHMALQKTEKEPHFPLLYELSINKSMCMYGF